MLSGRRYGMKKGLTAYHCKPLYFWRRRPDLNRGMKDLQSFALPLGHAAACIEGTRL